jgi:hypothetical protein
MKIHELVESATKARASLVGAWNASPTLLAELSVLIERLKELEERRMKCLMS